MKKLRTKLLLICLLITGGVLSQGPIFIKSYGNTGYDFGRDILQTLDTGYIATGSSSSFYTATADAFLMKVDSVGAFKWSYSYGGTGADWSEKVTLTSDSAFAFAGYTNSYGAGGFDFYVVKTDINGTPEWEKTFGGSDWDKAYSLVQLPDSGFVVVGETFSFGAGESDIYIVRTDKDGNEVWTQTYGGEGKDVAHDVVLLGDSLIIAGATESFGAGMQDGIVLNCGLDGTIGAVKVVGQEGDDYFNSITYQDDYVIMGGSRSYNYAEDCDCGADFWLYKVDTVDFSVIADTSWGGTAFGEDIVNDIVLSTSGDMFYGGSTTSWGSIDIAVGNTDAFLGKLLNTYFSAYDYVKNFGEQGNDALYGLDYCYDKGIVGIGTLPFQSTGGTNVMIIRVDEANSEAGLDIVDTENEIITLAIPDNELNTDLNIYPTLFDSYINIEGMPDNCKIEIVNLNGQVVFTETNNQTNAKLDLSELAKGTYFLHLNSDEGQHLQRIVKN